MRRLVVFLAALALPVLAAEEKIHIIPVDLRTPLEDFRITFENETTPRVQIPVKRGGFDVPNAELAAWTGMFYYAESDTSVTGMTVTAALTGSVFDATFEASQIGPTGTYFAQLLFTRADGRVQEWRRGRLTIRGAGGADAVQTVEWNTTNMWARINAIDADLADIRAELANCSSAATSNLIEFIEFQDARDQVQDVAIEEARAGATMGRDVTGPSTNATVVAIRNIPVDQLFPDAQKNGYALKYDHATGKLLLGPVATAGTAISNIVVLSGTASATAVPSSSIGLYRTIRPGNLPSAVVNVGGYEVAWFDLLGITLRAGTLKLLGDWLTVNTKAYDGSVTVPSRSYAAQPDMGTYRFSTGAGYAEGFTIASNRVWYWDSTGIHLEPGKTLTYTETDPLSIHASSTYTAWTNAGGTHATNAVVATSPLLTNGLQAVTWSASGLMSVRAQTSTNQVEWADAVPTAYPVYVRIAVTNDLPSPGDITTSVSNIVATSWTRPALLGRVNDTAGQQILVDAPETARAAASKAYVDAAAASVSPINWANYPAVAPIRANGQPILLGGGWTLQQTDGFGVVSQDSAGNLVIANNGVPGITVQSGLSGLRIDHFSVDSGTGTVGVATNGAVSAPMIQWTTDLGIPQWTTFEPVSTSYPDTTTNAWYEYVVDLPEGLPEGSPVFVRAVCQSGTARVDVHSPLYIEDQPVLTGFEYQGTNLLFIVNGVTNRIPMEIWP